MEEIRQFLLTKLETATDEDTKMRINILLKNEVIDRCKCPRCGEKFTPEEGFKSGILMYDYQK